MEFVTVKTYGELSSIAAKEVIELVKNKPDCVLGLATGSTPLGFYEKLVEAYEKGEVDFSLVKTVNLDEYYGLSGDNDQSYRYYMNTNLFDKINIKKENTHVPDGLAQDAESECVNYDKIIDEMGGVDIQILGIGHNGHIGFNEPAEQFSDGTHLVTLKESTIKANSRFFEKEEDVPTKAYTMGIGSIMKSKRIILMASGEEKKEIVNKAVNGDVTPSVPASVLQKHGNTLVIFSEEK